jgi:hypothetical protein
MNPHITKASIKLQEVYEKLKAVYLQVYAVSKDVIINPIEFWRKQKDINEDTTELLKILVLPLLAAVLVAVFLGGFFRGDYFSVGISLLWVTREIILLSILYFGGVFITRELVRRFGYDVEIPVLQKLVSYSLVPHMVVSVVTGLLPFFFFLDVFGIYSLYVFWLGARRLLPFPKETRDKYIIRIMAATWGVFAVASLLLAKILIGND